MIDRQKLVQWLKRLRLPDGSFLMHLDGEVDVRGTYCALAVAKLTNVFSEELFRDTGNWLLRYISTEVMRIALLYLSHLYEQCMIMYRSQQYITSCIC